MLVATMLHPALPGTENHNAYASAAEKTEGLDVDTF